MSSVLSSEEITLNRFRDYIRIESFIKKGINSECVLFLQNCCTELGFSPIVIEIESGFPILFFSWQGSDKKATSLLLNSHYDVVPAIDDLWSYPPFGAQMNENGNIYGRGTQDMKCVGMQGAF